MHIYIRRDFPSCHTQWKCRLKCKATRRIFYIVKYAGICKSRYFVDLFLRTSLCFDHKALLNAVRRDECSQRCARSMPYCSLRRVFAPGRLYMKRVDFFTSRDHSRVREPPLVYLGAASYRTFAPMRVQFLAAIRDSFAIRISLKNRKRVRVPEKSNEDLIYLRFCLVEGRRGREEG